MAHFAACVRGMDEPLSKTGTHFPIERVDAGGDRARNFFSTTGEVAYKRIFLSLQAVLTSGTMSGKSAATPADNEQIFGELGPI